MTTDQKVRGLNPFETTSESIMNPEIYLRVFYLLAIYSSLLEIKLLK
jgi:hypothetical protein